MFMRIWQSDGTTTDAPFEGVGGSFRVGVGTADGARSTIWNIWANRNKSDVYVAGRNVARLQKFSFHESGVYRYAWTKPEHALEYSGSDERVIDRWRRAEAGTAGWNHVLSILVQSDDVVEMPGPPEEAKVHWLPKTAPGTARALHVAIVKPDLGRIPLDGARPVNGLMLADGTTVMVLTSEVEVTPERARDLEAAIQEGEALAGPEMRRPGMRMALFGHADDSGVRWVWDTAYH